MSCPLLPSHTGNNRKSTFGWLASTSVSALLVSAIGAWALSIQDPGGSIGDMEDVVLVMLPPVAALEAVSEPTPDVADQAPSEEVDSPDAEDVPDTPELTEAPDIPDEVPEIEEVLAEEEPVVDTEPPKAVVELPKKQEKKEKKKEPKKKPVEKAEKKTEEAPKKKASQESAEAKASNKASNSQASVGQGKASAKSYAASVMKKVNRTKKKTAGQKGVAVVSFTIGDNGGLAGVRIAQGSGSDKVDQIALDHIRRSAPFPAPPPGVNRTYSFKFVAK